MKEKWERCSRCLELIDITGVIFWEGLCEICTDELHKEKKKRLKMKKAGTIWKITCRNLTSKVY
jgi:uncharacterized paraquat-inducible protein A